LIQMDKSALQQSALRTIALEQSAVSSLSDRIDDGFF